MKLAQLKALVKKGESERLEFKKSTAGLSAGMQTVCALLNSYHGGVVVFGVEDDWKIVGQHVTDKTRKEIADAINKIDLHEKIGVHYIPVSDDLHAITFAVNPGEKATHNDCTIKDLDHERIREVVRMAIFKGRLPETASNLSIPVILEKFELVNKGKLTNAAVILFCKNERKQFIQSNLRLARFMGIDKSEFINAKDLRANAFDLYDAAMDFLIYYLPVAARIEEGNPIRIETPAIPHKVLREAVTNALIHRDYSYEGGSMTIALYDDRVNITNIGALPKGIQLNQLTKEHSSIPRNPRIAHVFYLSGRIERWGRGTLDMIQDCKKAGNPSPKFKEVGDSFSLTLPLKEPVRTVIYKKPSAAVLSKLTDRQRAILEILEEGKLKTAQIKARLKGRFTERTLQLELTKLKQLGFVKSIGTTKAKAWYLPHIV